MKVLMSILVGILIWNHAMDEAVEISVAQGRTTFFRLCSQKGEAVQVWTILVLDDAQNVVWNLVPEGAYLPDENAECEPQHVFLRGGEHRVATATGEDAETLELHRGQGIEIAEFTFGTVPAGFIQVLPMNSETPTLQPGREYHVFVLGSHNAALTFRSQ